MTFVKRTYEFSKSSNSSSTFFALTDVLLARNTFFVSKSRIDPVIKSGWERKKCTVAPLSMYVRQ